MTSKNSFADFFPADEATVYALRSDVARLIRGYVRHLGSQTAVANRLGVQQSLVSNVMRGNVESLSLEKLIKLCVRAQIPGTAQWGQSPDVAKAVAGTWIVDVVSEEASGGELDALPTPQLSIAGWQFATASAGASTYSVARKKLVGGD